MQGILLIIYSSRYERSFLYTRNTLSMFSAVDIHHQSSSDWKSQVGLPLLLLLRWLWRCDRRSNSALILLKPSPRRHSETKRSLKKMCKMSQRHVNTAAPVAPPLSNSTTMKWNHTEMARTLYDFYVSLWYAHVQSTGYYSTHTVSLRSTIITARSL